jgi:hypothetical protein
MHELKLGDPAHQHGMGFLFTVETVHQLRHHDRDIVRRWRRVDSLAGRGVDYIVLNSPVLARSRGPAPDAFDKMLMDFPDQSLGNRTTTLQVLGNEVESLLIVKKLACIIGIDLGDRSPVQQSLGLLQG